MRNVLDISEAVSGMMKALGYVGSYDVRVGGNRSTGWVGKPGDGDDVALMVTISPLAPMERR